MPDLVGVEFWFSWYGDCDILPGGECRSFIFKLRSRNFRFYIEELIHRLMCGCMLKMVSFVLAFLSISATLLGEHERLHLNPVVAKLAEDETVYGLITGDVSLFYAKEVARAPVDFIYIDMEHNPLDLPALHVFLMGMTDKAQIMKQGNLQPSVAVFARFPTAVNQSEWVVKQALDIGLHGIIFNGIESGDQALMAVKSMRYPQLKDSKYFYPNGRRGAGARNAAWLWGLSNEEYDLHADLWPLNPDGDLLLIVMIESLAALQNVEAIASTPGIGALFVGNGNDLTRSMGVIPGSPEVEEAFQTVLRTCKAHKIACGISANTSEAVINRVKEGWHLIRSTVPAIEEARKFARLERG